MKFIDLSAQQERIGEEINRRIRTVLNHGRFIMGPEVEELESVLAEYVGVKNCISCSSGTDALLMALMAFGVGPGDAVITTSFTFVATAEVVSLLGAVPVFVDIDPNTYNINPVEIPLAIGRAKEKGLRVKGIIPVDLFGLPAEYGEIEKTASEHGLFVLEDGCQGFGGAYSGRKLCGMGDAAAASFYPAKPLGCYGDGGAVFTDDEEFAQRLRSIRIHGMGKDQYDNVRLGINGRMDTMQAAILLAKLRIFDEELAARQKIADMYSKALDGLVKVPLVPKNMKSGWALYSVKSPDRGKIQNRLSEAGIPTQVYYPKPLHLQPAYANLGYSKGDLPVSEETAERILSLPMHPYLKEEEVNRVIEEIVRAVS